MPEAVIVATGRTPIGRANKGSLVECRPDDLSALVLRSVLEQVPQLEPRRGGGRHPRLRAAGRRGRLQRRPGGRAPGRAGQRARRHGEPLLLLVPADHPYGGPRHPRRRGRRLHRRRRRDGEPLRARRVGHRSPQHGVRRGRGADQGPRPRRDRAVEPAGRPARRLHRHGPDGRERGRVREGHPRGDGRVRAALADPGRRVPAERVLRARDHPGHPVRRDGRDQGRRAAGRHDARGAVQPQAGVPRGRDHHGRQRLPAQRRRRRRHRHERHQGQGARHHAAGAHRGQRRDGPQPRDHGPRPGRRLPPGPGPGRT